MTELSLNEPAGVLIKTTCVDYPGRIAGSFFFKGCNLLCPYCYNTSLVTETTAQNLSTVQELFNHLEKRQGILKGLVISGGEPLINPYTPLIIKKARELNYSVKLDTNGTLPDQLQNLINNQELKPDFLAIDLKTTPENYANILCSKHSKNYGNKEYFKELLLKTKTIAEQFDMNNLEYRTVLVPGLVTIENIKEISDFVPENTTWQFAQFQNKNCLNPDYNEITPYTDQETKEIIKDAKKYHKESNLR